MFLLKGFFLKCAEFVVSRLDSTDFLMNPLAGIKANHQSLYPKGLSRQGLPGLWGFGRDGDGSVAAHLGRLMCRSKASVAAEKGQSQNGVH